MDGLELVLIANVPVEIAKVAVKVWIFGNLTSDDWIRFALCL